MHTGISVVYIISQYGLTWLRGTLLAVKMKSNNPTWSDSNRSIWLLGVLRNSF